jgi:DNA-binding beta-propeller fold protein YncE
MVPRRSLALGAAAFGLALLADVPSATAQRLYWADAGSRRVLSALLDGTDVRVLAANVVEHPMGVALDPAAGKVYWFDLERSKIGRADLDGTHVEDLVDATYVSPSLPTPVLDAAGGWMYWTEQGGIRRAHLDGSSLEVLSSGGAFGPTGLALDTAGGKMYWTDSQTIHRASLDGSAAELLVATGAPLGNQSALTLDLHNRKIYWMASLELYQPARIQRANLDGSQVEDVVLAARSFPGSTSYVTLDPVGGRMYWTDDVYPWGIRSARLDGSDVRDVVTSTAGVPERLLLDAAGGALFFVIPSPGRIQRVGLDGSSLTDVAADGLQSPDRLGLDASGRLYWSDGNARRIERAGFDGANRREVGSALVRSPGGVAVDPVAGEVYWADAGKVFRARRDGSSRVTFASTGASFPGGVAFDPVGGKVYWSVPLGGIRRANRDGSGEEQVVAAGVTSGLALDPAAGKIYWGEAFAGRLRRASLDGSLVETLVTGQRLGGGVEVDPVAGALYWSDVGSRPIQLAVLEGGIAIPLAATAGAVGVAIDRNTHRLYWTARAFDFEPAAIRRAGPGGVETLVVDDVREPRGIAVEPELAPLAATGMDRSVGPGFDSFVRVVESVPTTEPVGSIGAAHGAVKDVDVDPQTGMTYTVGLLPSLRGQQVYAIDPSTGRGTPLPERTGLAPPALVWGLAFDAGGTLYGGGVGVYVIDKTSGRATLLADVTRVPALILGMAGSPDGTGFVSTGLVLSPSGLLPYVAEHDADGTFLNDRVLVLTDPGGAARRLLDIAFSDAGVVYGIAAPGRHTPPASAGGDPRGVLAAARATPRAILESLAAAETEHVRRGLTASGPRSDEHGRRSELVALYLAGDPSAPVAAMTTGAPLASRLLGLGRTIPASSRPPPRGDRGPAE